MDIKDYIVSGVLELYVAGKLSETENLEVAAMAKEHVEVRTEIEAIEKAILELTRATAPNTVLDFEEIRDKIAVSEPKVIPITKPGTAWFNYVGWAASVLLAVGLLWMYNNNLELRTQMEAASEEKLLLEEQIANANNSLEQTTDLLNTIREKGISVTSLAGQQVSPDSYAKVYWNKTEEKVYIDAMGLPEPPPGMVYQVWSLKLDPLTPTSVGLLEDFTSDENRIFALTNSNESEAFGITLEPAGGSESPTLEQLYTLGVVSS
ncbi:anti-sigma factor domain-containing protein [Muriicola sp. E247]|uniref:anti-sigma factor n=1 Tax=Muriicola sp. E247 TaxID=3242730 RepID=UPI003525E512